MRRDGVLSDFSVLFVIPKSSKKVSMIANLRYLNLFSHRPLPRCILPTVKHIMMWPYFSWVLDGVLSTCVGKVFYIRTRSVSKTLGAWPGY